MKWWYEWVGERRKEKAGMTARLDGKIIEESMKICKYVLQEARQLEEK